MRRALPVLVLILVASALYANTLPNGFVDDDRFQVLRNPWIRDLGRLPEASTHDVWGFVKSEGGSSYYRPLMHVTYAATYQIFGLKAWGFHLVNVAFHAACTVMVFLLGSRIGAGAAAGSRALVPPAFAAALLFAAHPVHTEAVAWIAALPDLGMTFFFLAAILCHARVDRPLDRRHLAAAAAFLAALLFKETALTLPLALAAWDLGRGPRKGGARGHLGVYAVYAAPAALYLALRFAVLADPFGPGGGGQAASLPATILSAAALYGEYLRILLAPIQLAFWHTFEPVVSLLSFRGMLAVALVAATGLGLAISFRKDRAIFVALLLGILPLLPVIHAQGIAGTPFAERYLYLPSAGLILAALLILSRAVGGGTWGIPLLLAPILILCAIGTVRRNAIWRDEISLYSDTVARSPEAATPRYLLAVALQEAGRTDEAIGHYRILVEAEPHVARYRASFGDALMLIGNLDEAIEQLETAIDLDPRSREAHNDLGNALRAKGRAAEALVSYRKALAIDPAYAAAHYNLGAALSLGGQIAGALAHLEEAVRLEPANAHYHNVLGIEYARQGRTREAIAQLEAAVRLAPDEPGYRRNLDGVRTPVSN